MNIQFVPRGTHKKFKNTAPKKIRSAGVQLVLSHAVERKGNVIPQDAQNFRNEYFCGKRVNRDYRKVKSLQPAKKFLVK